MAQLQFLQNAGLNVTQEHTIHFQSENAQDTFWSARVITTADVGDQNILSRVLEETPVAYGKPKQTLLGINYCRLLQDGKWWYFFIINKKYINDNTTNLTMKLDVLQTFLIGIDYSIAESYIEREHQNRYEYINTILSPIFNRESENVEKGRELIVSKDVVLSDNYPSALADKLSDPSWRLFWLTIVTKERIDSSGDTYLTTNKGMPTNVYTYIAPLCLNYRSETPTLYFANDSSAISSVDYSAINRNDLIAISQDPKVLSINISKYSPIPYNVNKGSATFGGISFTIYNFYPTITEVGIEPQIKKVEFYGTTRYLYRIENAYEIGFPEYALDPEVIPTGVISHNNLKDIKFEPKLLTEEYQPLLFQYGGNKMVLDRSNFGTNPAIKHLPTFSVKNTSTLAPARYKGEEQNLSFALKLDSSNNEMPLRTDAWQTYLAGHKNSLVTGMATQAITGVLGIGASLLTGNPFGFVNAIKTGVNVATGIADSIAQIHDLKETPDEVSKPSNDIIEDYINEGGNIHLKYLQIRESFLQKVFEWLYHYGYATKTFKVPDINTRYYFNYLQTIGANIVSNIDNEYITEIKSILDRGVTFWHYRDAQTWKGIENYEYENAELTLDGGV